MATWNELFFDEKNIAVLPQPEIYKFAKKVEGIFPGEKLKFWDFCCGAGRHTILLSSLGYDTNKPISIYKVECYCTKDSLGNAANRVSREGGQGRMPACKASFI